MAGNPNEDRFFPRRREDISAVQHWDQSLSSRSQRWYVQLCLLASSARDQRLAHDLASQGHGNWSATTAYYSLVHACRSLLFQCFGDFPRSHQEMARFFDFDNQHTVAAREQVRFNWLSGFLGGNIPNLTPRGRRELESVRDMFKHFFQEELEEGSVLATLGRYGFLIMLAKELREDSNYEALLIANEHGHFLVSPSVHELGSRLMSLAKLAVTTAADVVVAGLRRDQAIEGERAEFNAFAHRFFVEYLAEATPVRLMLDQSCSFQSWYHEQEIRLREAPTADRDRLNALVEGIRYGVFGPKAALMRDYRRKIERFGTELERISETAQGTLFSGEHT